MFWVWLPRPLEITLKVYVLAAVKPKSVWSKLSTSFSSLTHLVHVTVSG